MVVSAIVPISAGFRPQMGLLFVQIGHDVVSKYRFCLRPSTVDPNIDFVYVDSNLDIQSTISGLGVRIDRRITQHNE